MLYVIDLYSLILILNLMLNFQIYSYETKKIWPQSLTLLGVGVYGAAIWIRNMRVDFIWMENYSLNGDSWKWCHLWRHLVLWVVYLKIRIDVVYDANWSFYSVEMQIHILKFPANQRIAKFQKWNIIFFWYRIYVSSMLLPIIRI